MATQAVDVEATPELVARYDHSAPPTSIALKDQRVAKIVVGVQAEAALREVFHAAAGTASARNRTWASMSRVFSGGRAGSGAAYESCGWKLNLRVISRVTGSGSSGFGSTPLSHIPARPCTIAKAA